MAESKTYSVELIHGHRITRRGLAFLICEGDENIDAKRVFEKLKSNRQRQLHTRFDYWLDGGINTNWFHGWYSTPTYKDCFVFKWKENRQDHRFYGFLCNPLLHDKGFQLCVLVVHTKKNTWETDLTELDGVNKIRNDDRVKEAIMKAVKASIPPSKKW